MTVTLVTGGVRSGKSRHAEALLRGRPNVTYVATHRPTSAGAAPDDEWERRVAIHRARRPPEWKTVETHDAPGAVVAASGDVLLECLGTWLTGVVDDGGAWDDLDDGRRLVRDATAQLLTAITELGARRLVVVTNEVGLSLVPTTSSGRFFQDELGTLNAAVAARADHVHLVVAGRVLQLPAAASADESG